MVILGISAFYHDSAACIVKNGAILSAVQEERFSRIKHDHSFPFQSVQFCLKQNRLRVSDIDFVVFYDKPFLKFERLLETYLAFAPKGFTSFLKAFPVWIKDKLFQKKTLLECLSSINKNISWRDKLLFSEHHLSHAASAFFPSPFKESAILTMDGVGEWTTSSISLGIDNNIETVKEINFPHSLGLLYSAFTYYLGFKVNSGEYKMMGLAPYGKPTYTDIIKDHLIDIKPDGSFRLNMKYFSYATELTMTNKKFNKLFHGLQRKDGEKISDEHMNIAASIQKITDEIVIKIAKDIKKETNQDNLCLAGGVALNCVTNGRLLKTKIFKNIWVQPAAGDAGGALGAALAVNHLMLKNKRQSFAGDLMKGSYLGPSFTKAETYKRLTKIGAVFKTLPQKSIAKTTAKAITEGKIVGWFQGRAEFGPRALGNRSILADSRSASMQKNLNLKIKFRESFRPFAPSILVEDIQSWFDHNSASPYMLFVAKVKGAKKINTNENPTGFAQLKNINSKIPAVTHVDFSARIQTVDKSNKLYFDLITEFKKITGCPIIINTSFNVRGEPIVNSPEDAFRCFIETDIDVLVINNCILLKDDQLKKKNTAYLDKYLND
ncbi:carbamoyltransferase [Methylophilaceae bacterium]|nr:carbamoyltransferase [Methylophilaceae bacterium]